MADRRMFSKKIINTAKYLRLPVTTRDLYFFLTLWADDDGIVEAFPIMKLTDAQEDDLKLLVTKDFVKILDEDMLIVVITDWLEHNKIRADRKVDSIYKDLLKTREPNIKTVEAKETYYSRIKNKQTPSNQLSTICQTNDGQLSTSCQPFVGIGKVRLGKVRLGKSRLEEVSKEKEREEKRREENVPPKPPTPSDSSSAKKQYAEFVSLTEEEYNKLVSQHGEEATLECVEILDNYKGASGKKYKSDYRAILTWVLDKYRERHRVKPLEARASPARNDAQATIEEMKRRIEARYQNDGQADTTDPF